jgi:hypothetical protein
MEITKIHWCHMTPQKYPGSAPVVGKRPTTHGYVNRNYKVCHLYFLTSNKQIKVLLSL